MTRIGSVEVSIIVPTFREAENLPELIKRISKATVTAGLSIEIIVVDDDSNDGTEAVCHDLAIRYPLRLIVRKSERGLSSAVIAGMREAKGEKLVVMDADLSHPPERVVNLAAALDDPAIEMVIGSRYVKGGATTEDWGLLRWINSKAATLLARPFTSSKDPMAGFFALRQVDFKAAEATLDPIGYKIGLELIVKCGFRSVAEIPILFANRLKGESKLTLREQLNYLWHLKRLADYRYGKLAKLSQFTAVGLSGMILDIACFTILLGAAPVSVARAVAIWVAMTWNFALNRTFTFSQSRRDPIWRQYMGFCGGCLTGAVVTWSVSLALLVAHPWFASHQLVAAVAGAVFGAGTNFLACYLFVFRGDNRQLKTAKTEQLADTTSPASRRKAA